MKKSRIKQIIKEVLLEEKGYSKYIPGGETSGLDKKTLDNILLRIAKGERPSEEEHSVARGNRILDKADPENVDRITRGEKPIYENEIERMQELAGLQQEIKVNNPMDIKTYEQFVNKFNQVFSNILGQELDLATIKVGLDYAEEGETIQIIFEKVDMEEDKLQELFDSTFNQFGINCEIIKDDEDLRFYLDQFEE